MKNFLIIRRVDYFDLANNEKILTDFLIFAGLIDSINFDLISNNFSMILIGKNYALLLHCPENKTFLTWNLQLKKYSEKNNIALETINEMQLKKTIALYQDEKLYI